jgi:hypothetical protein
MMDTEYTEHTEKSMKGRRHKPGDAPLPAFLRVLCVPGVEGF